MSREAGILMPVSSLPGPYGIGDLGETAYAFVDFLAQAGQTYWQILPLNPPNHNKSKDSPTSPKTAPISPFPLLRAIPITST